MKTPKSLRLRFGVLWLLPLLFVCNFTQATTIHFYTELSGAAESSPNTSLGTGWANVYFDDVALTLRVQTQFGGLEGTVTAAHIHAATAVANTGTAGVATSVPTFLGFPMGVSSGSYDQTFDLTNPTSFNPTYIAAHGGTVGIASQDLLTAMLAEKTYLNIHSSKYPGGEIRGFLRQVPDSASTLALMSVALGGIAYLRRVWRVRR